MHGGTYLIHRTEGVIQQRAMKATMFAAILLVLSFLGAGVYLQWIDGYRITSLVNAAALPDPLNKTVVKEAGAWMLNFEKAPILWALPLIGLLAPLLTILLIRIGRSLSAFISSALAITGVIGTAGAAMFPFVMPSSSMPSASLTIWDSASSHLTLAIMFWATVIFMPLIILYTSWAYRVMRGKVTEEQIQANEHSAY
jgi:cytochrome d ubiquinol oxidase subunit II